MPDIKFNYEIACECISAGITVNNTLYGNLIDNSIKTSLETSREPVFLDRFREKPDTIDTQVDMYATLLDDVCRRIGIGFNALEENAETAEGAASSLSDYVRATYTICAAGTMVGIEDRNRKAIQLAAVAYTKDVEVAKRFPYETTPLMVAYLLECLGDEKPTSEVIRKGVSDFMDKLKARKIMDELGKSRELIANLEVALL